MILFRAHRAGFLCVFIEDYCYTLRIIRVSVSQMAELVFGRVKQVFARFIGTVMARILVMHETKPVQ